MTKFFYTTIGIWASLQFAVLLYWSLQLDSSISSLISNTKNQPVYLWSYAVLTLAAIILFGLNITLLVYRVRKYGWPKFRKQTGTGIGSLIGIAASACSVCGSTILSVIGITGGLAVFPLQGLELKALSVAFLALPIWLTYRELKRFECGEGICPVPRDYSFRKKDWRILTALMITVPVLLWAGWGMVKLDQASGGFCSIKEKIL